MMGHAVFPDIIDGEARWYESVRGRFLNGVFPQNRHACSAVTLKCWQQQHKSAECVVRDLESIEREQQSGTFLPRFGVDCLTSTRGDLADGPR